jgi:cellulose synthase/poly-beta-1,6-N-acetylglucosamine synthase-like glycosyltransferase
MAQSSQAPRVTDPPARVTLGTAARALFAVSTLLFILVSTVTGAVVFAGNITPLGIYLVGRAALQTVFSRRNLKKMRGITRSPLVEAIKNLAPEENWAWLEKLTRNPMHYELWRQEILNHPVFAQNPERWTVVIQESFREQELLRAGAVVPCYGIAPNEIQETLASLEGQTYPFSEIVIVLNEPGNQAARGFIANWVTTKNAQGGITKWHFIDRDRPGKRGAMAAGFRKLRELGVDIIVNVDGDTSADVDALANTVRVFIAEPETALLTSNVRIKNLDRTKIRGNMLKLWTFFRYDYANSVERGAQSHFLNVTCGSGPWLALRANLIDEDFVTEFLTHTYRGAEVRPGDDRFATRQMNRKKLSTVYSPEVLVWTDCPEDWRRFRSQQSRWAQSAHINFVQQTVQ